MRDAPGVRAPEDPGRRTARHLAVLCPGVRAGSRSSATEASLIRCGDGSTPHTYGDCPFVAVDIPTSTSATAAATASKYRRPLSAVALAGLPQPVSGWLVLQGRGVQTPGWR